jgi:hypothetical protein
MLYGILLAIIIVLFLLKRYREHFVMSYIWNDEQKELSFEEGPDSTGVGNRIFGTTPHTCNKGHELQDGLCYEKCRNGYHGVGPVCWADTDGIGVGTIPDLTPEIRTSWGSIGCTGDRPFRWKGYDDCYNIKVLIQVCDEDREMFQGLCYRRCPKDKPNRVPGMPYLCYKGGPLSYGRGVGLIPPIFKFGNGA